MTQEGRRDPVWHQVIPKEPLSFEISDDAKPGMPLPDCGEASLPAVDLSRTLGSDALRNDSIMVPQLSEPEVVRHFTRLSMLNYQIDAGIYPLGSCTMKHNPRINEAIARSPAVASAHPDLPDDLCQGHLRVMYELAADLAEITGLPAVTLQPAAGAQGEFAALKVASAYFKDIGQDRRVVITTDSAHGTNPSSAAICGFDVVEVPTQSDGLVHPEDVLGAISDKVAVFMVTNPNTLGRFERFLPEISAQIHRAGGLVYCDGANLNAILGVTRPAEFGADMIHINLHKTFSTPHGGGGPGSGPICCIEKLRPYLPDPRIERQADGIFRRVRGQNPKTIGAVKSFFGNFGMLMRAWTYIRSNGPEGLRAISDNAVLNANYLKARLVDLYPEGLPGPTLHEAVLTDKLLKAHGVTTAELAKMLLDYGVHPPTVYFPLIVKGAIMIEPTESEGLAELDRFVYAMRQCFAEAREGQWKDRRAPELVPRTKIDETRAARNPTLTWMDAQQARDTP